MAGIYGGLGRQAQLNDLGVGTTGITTRGAMVTPPASLGAQPAAPSPAVPSPAAPSPAAPSPAGPVTANPVDPRRQAYDSFMTNAQKQYGRITDDNYSDFNNAARGAPDAQGGYPNRILSQQQVDNAYMNGMGSVQYQVPQRPQMALGVAPRSY